MDILSRLHRIPVGVLYTSPSELYPVDFCAFGSGWAGAVGSIGGSVAPMVVATIMDGRWLR